jgi:hypothetical protein
MNSEEVRAQYKFNARTVVNLTAVRADPPVVFTIELTERGFVCSVWAIGRDGPALHTATVTNPFALDQTFRDWGYEFDATAWQ